MSKSLKKLIDINRLREFKNKLVGTDSPYVQTGAVDQTIAGTKTFSKPIVGSVTGSSGSCTGNAATATTATTAKSCTGNAATATRATQDAAGNTITTTYATKAENNTKANNSEVVHKSGDETIAGTKTFSNGVLSTAVNAFMAQNKGYTVLLRNDGSKTYLLMSDKGGVPGTWSDAKPLTISNSTGVCSINGNASTATNATNATNANHAKSADTATKLATARTINGTSFNGSANITTANWGTARNITITDGTNTSTAVSVNGSANVSLNLPGTIKATFVGNVTGNVTGNCSGSSGSCTGNAATATKLAAKRTIALSGAATGTATGFDGSGNITIPVTALAASAIRAQWYAAYPDGPEAHNAMWGGRDITAAFNNGTVSANIANGTFRDIFPGDYITKQVTIPRAFADDGVTMIFEGGTYTVNWVVADCDYWWHKGDQNNGMETHHVVIVPQVPIFNARMNPTNTTEGGYAGSEMRRSVIPACATGIVNAFGSDHILTFRDHLTQDLNTSAVSSGITVFTGAPNWNGEWHSQQCNLMSEAMVYDGPHCASSALDNIMAARQMSAFRLSERLINYSRQWWWLRDVGASAYFAYVGGYGSAGVGGASVVRGVRPFALLK